MEQIPTINYHDLKSNNVELSKFLEDSLNDVGFFVIKDHPISSESIDKLFNFTQELFDLPLDVKMKYHLELSLHLIQFQYIFLKYLKLCSLEEKDLCHSQIKKIF